MDLAFLIARTRCAHDSLVLSLRKRKRLGRKPSSSSCALDPSSRSLNFTVARCPTRFVERSSRQRAISWSHPSALLLCDFDCQHSSPSPLLKFCPTACAAAAVAAQAAAVAMYTAAAVVADCTRTSIYAQHEQVRTFRVC